MTLYMSHYEIYMLTKILVYKYLKLIIYISNINIFKINNNYIYVFYTTNILSGVCVQIWCFKQGCDFVHDKVVSKELQVNYISTKNHLETYSLNHYPQQGSMIQRIGQTQLFYRKP